MSFLPSMALGTRLSFVPPAVLRAYSDAFDYADGTLESVSGGRWLAQTPNQIMVAGGRLQLPTTQSRNYVPTDVLTTDNQWLEFTNLANESGFLGTVGLRATSAANIANNVSTRWSPTQIRLVGGSTLTVSGGVAVGDRVRLMVRGLRGLVCINGCPFIEGSAPAIPTDVAVRRPHLTSGTTVTANGWIDNLSWGDLPDTTRWFGDDFVGTAGQTITSRTGWSVQDGGVGDVPTIANNGTSLTNNTADFAGLMVVSPELGSLDQSVSARFLNTNGGPFVCCSVTDRGNWLGIRRNGGNANVFKCVGGTYTSLGTTSGTAVANATLVTLRVYGSGFNKTWELWLGSVRVLNGVFPNDVPLTTRQGLASRGATVATWLDDYVALTLAPAA